jgi:predicted PurR-regulated permease PerM
MPPDFRARLDGDTTLRAAALVSAAVLLCAGLAAASSVLVPATFALFVIAVAWPIQKLLQQRLPRLLALAVTLLLVIVTIALLAGLVAWGFTRVGRWVIANGGRFQDLYLRQTRWLDDQGLPVGEMLNDNFDMRWLVIVAQYVTGHMSGFISFLVVTLVFTLLGLLEVGIAAGKLARMAPDMLRASVSIGRKLQIYMAVRTAMSAMTGITVGLFVFAVGLDLPLEWGVIAFVVNYIPFVGSLIATVLPTLFAGLQFGSWRTAIVVFICLNLIQFLWGSYVEPRLAGRAVSVSPFLVLFAVFFWAYLWGIAGAFIGIPLTIAILAVCAEYSATRWIADLLSGRED